MRLETDFRRCGLPVSCPYPLPELAEAMRKDKKADGEIIHFILPRTVTSPTVRGRMKWMISPSAFLSFRMASASSGSG